MTCLFAMLAAGRKCLQTLPSGWIAYVNWPTITGRQDERTSANEEEAEEEEGEEASWRQIERIEFGSRSTSSRRARVAQDGDGNLSTFHLCRTEKKKEKKEERERASQLAWGSLSGDFRACLRDINKAC